MIANQDASSIPFPITFMGAIVTMLWLIYGLILLNEFMIVSIAMNPFIGGFLIIYFIENS